jgi:hypothetical protein
VNGLAAGDSLKQDNPIGIAESVDMPQFGSIAICNQRGLSTIQSCRSPDEGFWLHLPIQEPSCVFCAARGTGVGAGLELSLLPISMIGDSIKW